jgi:sulfur-carrier protein
MGILGYPEFLLFLGRIFMSTSNKTERFEVWVSTDEKATVERDALMSSIQINLKLFSVYQEALGTAELQSSFPVGTTAGQVLDRLIEQHPQLAQWRSITRLGVNLQFVEPTEVLADGDEVVFIPPVSGG